MTRLLGFLLPVLLVLLSVPLGATVALSYDAAYFERLQRLFGLPGRCDAPCFIGIQPGQTTTRAALASLPAMDWDEPLDGPSLNANLLEATMPLEGLKLHMMLTGPLDGPVYRVDLVGELSLGAALHVFGAPDRVESAVPPRAPDEVRYQLSYAPRWTRLSLRLPVRACGVDFIALLDQSVRVRLGGSSPGAPGESPFGALLLCGRDA